MKLLKPIILLIIFAMTVVSCHREDGPVEPPVPVKRTVLVYMVADNSLGSVGYDHDDIEEMLQAAGDNGLNGCRLLVYHAGRGRAAVLEEVTAAGLDTLNTYSYNTEVYSTDTVRMNEVIADSRRLAPAHDYGLVLWSHGNGWIEPAGSRQNAPQRAFGEDRGTYMKVTSLARTLEGKDFSWIYFDCCHMMSIEVMYEMRHCAPVIVGSVTELPAAGMPYQHNVPVFVADNPDMVQAARNTFDYYNLMSGSNRTCTMTVISTEGLEDLADATRAIMESGAESLTRSSAQAFMLQTCTLYDFGQYIDATLCDNLLKSAWHEALDKVILYKNATPYVWSRLQLRYYSGLGTYILESPSDADYKGYSNCAWWRDVVSHNPRFQEPM